MKKVTVEDYLYEFYRKVGKQAGFKTEKVMSDTLFKLAGGLSVKALREQERKYVELNEQD